MHTIEPHFLWRNSYISEEDVRSPFHDRDYSEFEYSTAIYNHLIHPQWDEFGSPSLFLKVLFANYEHGYAIIELIGEWNDCLHNDIMFLKRDVADIFMESGISKFILVGENVLNFHYSDDCYYEEWFEELSDVDGWIALVNFTQHVMREFEAIHIDQYIITGGNLSQINWRTLTPEVFFKSVEHMVERRFLSM